MKKSEKKSKDCLAPTMFYHEKRYRESEIEIPPLPYESQSSQSELYEGFSTFRRVQYPAEKFEKLNDKNWIVQFVMSSIDNISNAKISLRMITNFGFRYWLNEKMSVVLTNTRETKIVD